MYVKPVLDRRPCLKGVSFQSTVSLEPVVGCFPQTYHLEKGLPQVPTLAFSMEFWVKNWKDLKVQKYEMEAFAYQVDRARK